MLTRVKPHVSQILKNPEIQNPAKQLSLLQGNSKRQIAPATAHFISEQKKQRLLMLMRKALQTRKKNSKRRQT